MSFSLSNVSAGTGIDVQGTVAQLMTTLRAPETQLQAQQKTLSSQTNALQSISSFLNNLQTNVQALTNLSGPLSARAATSSNTSLLTATSDGTAAITNHQIVINSLAKTSSYYSNAITSSSPAITAGTFNISVGGGTAVPITVDSTNNTLDGIAKTINAANAGVTASVIVDTSGSRLSILSSTSGAAGDVTISGNTTTGLSFTKAVTGTDASLQVDGINISSGSNTVKNVIQGVTLQLQGANSGSTVSLGIAPDTTQGVAAIQSFVNSYNNAITAINAQSVYDPVNKLAQPLEGDSSLAIAQQQLYSGITYSTGSNSNNGITSLASLGITTNNDGTLSLDTTKLSSVLVSQNTDVLNFFQTASTGFAQNFNTSLTSLNDPTQGALSVELSSISSEQNSLSSQINDFEARMATQQTMLLKEYSTINATLEQMPTLLSQIQNQLGSVG